MISNTVPIFYTLDWLNCVSQEASLLGLASYSDTVHNLTVLLPWQLRISRLGLRTITNPDLTQTAGPLIINSSGHPVSDISTSILHSLYAKAFSQLPFHHHFEQVLHPSSLNTLPLLWEGYNVSVSYTYRLDLSRTLDDIWSSFSTKTRNVIRKSNRLGLRVSDSTDIHELYNLYHLTFSRQSLHPPFSFNQLSEFVQNAQDNNLISIRKVTTEDSEICSIAIFVISQDCCYYLLSATNPDLRSTGSNSLLLWDTICRYHQYSSSFDFEGSSVPSIETFFRSFGPTLTPLYTISRRNPTILSRPLDLLTKLLR